MNEIEISTELDNPNIVKIYEIFEFNQSVYIVTEYTLPNQVSAKEENSSIDSTRQAVSQNMTPELFSDKWLSPSTISTKRK